MGAGVDRCTDFGQMRLHGLGIAPRHDQARALAFGWADRSKYVCRFGALIVGRSRSGSALGPTAGDLVLLADPGFVLPPQFYLGSRWEAFADILQFGRKSFLKSSRASSFCAWWRGRAEIFR